MSIIGYFSKALRKVLFPVPTMPSTKMVNGFFLMSGSCHFDRASNDEFSVEFLIIVVVIVFKP